MSKNVPDRTSGETAVGTITHSKGVIPFGPGHPTLLINDLIGESYQEPQVLDDAAATQLQQRLGTTDEHQLCETVPIVESHLLSRPSQLRPQEGETFANQMPRTAGEDCAVQPANRAITIDDRSLEEVCRLVFDATMHFVGLLAETAHSRAYLRIEVALEQRYQQLAQPVSGKSDVGVRNVVQAVLTDVGQVRLDVSSADPQ